ncbi:bifunctional biotin--[acetyl-CoA-carboxylase] ligase/biotin operon repressor BirA [Methylomonas sp. SURF-2]|uniref:Bifunctional ligase/repressor BirA n=1 Tax=Methylomonas subterranea TaxID=2952225 RepID=A0ABT1TB29_9GAMM|nr:bifunctional biotin--[acetyl-CoA-carboxylase] ligase/biotin operon repressor BirA [Methylomonas sp. SURF-2]MCQ8102671.1 bifunctional biotin--[acetyl-CoA-carboxylase] ligase/biotin operon repressor BirA [Methylomonas sp. SURF-2]
MSIPGQLLRLLNLLADGRFHSGTELARLISVSRSAVWKHLRALDELGIELLAVSGKGYRLQRPLQLLDSEHIAGLLAPRARSLISQLEIHPALASTNGYLSALAQQTPATGRVCLAEYQSAGKGRRGRGWVSPFGHNVYLSVLWRYQSGPGALAGLSLALGVAVVRALSRAGISEVGLKWPNDIYWRGRKLAGILIEVSGESSGPCHAVIGLGLNLYLPPAQAEAIDQAWVDLIQIMGEDIMSSRNRLVALLLNEMLPVIADFEHLTLQGFIDEWRKLDCMLGEAVNVYIGEQAFAGMVRGIDEQGMLLLEDPQGKLRAFASGEVSFRST